MVTQSCSQLRLTMTFDFPAKCSEYSCTPSLESVCLFLLTPTASFPLIPSWLESIWSRYCQSLPISLHPTQCYKIITLKHRTDPVNPPPPPPSPQKPAMAPWYLLNKICMQVVPQSWKNLTSSPHYLSHYISWYFLGSAKAHHSLFSVQAHNFHH